MTATPDFYWTRTSSKNLQLVKKSVSVWGRADVVMAIYNTHENPSSAFQPGWYAYDPRNPSIHSVRFDDVVEAKIYCEVTAKLTCS